MSYDKMLYEAQKHWRKKQRQQRRMELLEAAKQEYEEHKEEINIVKKAAFIAVYIEKTDYRRIKVEVSDILSKVQSIAELDYYYYWCFGRLNEDE